MWSSYFLNIFYVFILTTQCSSLKCPHTNLKEVQENILENDVSVFYYYVSWCAESQRDKPVFDEVALSFRGLAYFAMVDCHHLTCNCTLGRNSNWPLILGYYKLLNEPIVYKGYRTYTDLSRFVTSLLKPVHRVNSNADIKTLLSTSSAVVLGLFSNPGGQMYNQYVLAAVKFREIDWRNSFQFGVGIGTKGKFIEEESRDSQIVLLSKKNVKKFNHTNYSMSNLLLWLQEEFNNSYNSMHEYDNPSRIALHMRNGPVLALFGNGTAITKTTFQQKNNLSSRTFDIGTKCSLKKQQLNSCLKNNIDFIDFCEYFHIHKAIKTLFQSKTENLLSSDVTSIKLFQRQLNDQHRNDLVQVDANIARFIQNSADQFFAKTRQNYTRFSVVLLKKECNQLFPYYLKDIDTKVAFIFDPEHESIYSMEEKFTYGSVLNFIHNFFFRRFLLQPFKTESSTLKLPVASNSIYLEEANSKIFSSFVELEKTTVLLLYSPQCIYSSIMSHLLLQLKAILDSNEIHFVRLNVKSHTIPWEFTMFKAPNVIVFPRGDYSKSRIFPKNLEINISNMLGFLLGDLAPVDQVKLILKSCKQKSITEHFQKCMQYVAALVMHHITQQLKNWKIFADDRENIFETLKDLKDISLSIQKDQNKL